MADGRPVRRLRTRDGSDGEASTKSAAGAAAEIIRREILAGRLAPGSRLKEEELARELRISRTPVREAILVLQAEGLLQWSPRRGATVRAYGDEELEELYQLRAVVEGFAARRAATRITPEAIAELAASCDRYRELRLAGDVPGIVQENMRFHNTVLDAAGSELLGEVVRRVIERPLVYRSFASYTDEESAAAEHAHRALVAAFVQRDAERAEIVMKEHVFEARDVLLGARRVKGSAAGDESQAAAGEGPAGAA